MQNGLAQCNFIVFLSSKNERYEKISEVEPGFIFNQRSVYLSSLAMHVHLSYGFWRRMLKKIHTLVFLYQCYFVSFLPDLSSAGVASDESVTHGGTFRKCHKKQLCNMSDESSNRIFFSSEIHLSFSEVLSVSISLTNLLGTLLSLAIHTAAMLHFYPSKHCLQCIKWK